MANLVILSATSLFYLVSMILVLIGTLLTQNRSNGVHRNLKRTDERYSIKFKTSMRLFKGKTMTVFRISTIEFQITQTPMYCWFSVSRHSKQVKIKIKTVQQIKSRIWEMKEGKYADSGQVSGHSNFSYARYAEEFLPKFIKIYMETPCWCPSVWAPTWWPETNINIRH